MSRIDDLIRQYAPDGVEYKALGEVGTFVRGNGLQKKDLLDEGVPAIHYGQVHTVYGVWTTETVSFVAPELAVKLRDAEPGDLVIATTSEDDDNVAKATAWLGAEPAAISGDAYIYRHSFDPKYIAYYFQSDHFQAQKKAGITGAKVRRISGMSLAKIRVPVPPLEVQRAIVKFLDAFTELGAELGAELEARRYQYTHYRDLMLDPSGDGGIRRYVSIGELTSSITSGRNKLRSLDGEFPVYGSTGALGLTDAPEHTGDALLVARVGANAGLVKVVWGRFGVSDNTLIVRPTSDWNVRFAFHQLVAMNLNQYAVGGGQPLITGRLLKSLEVPLPDIEEQKRIAAVLDKFDALVNDLSSGLPAEIEARRQQYAYYRDRLLSFEEAVA